AAFRPPIILLTSSAEDAMALVTFTSPALKKDITVYATAGDTHTLLSVAKAHKIPLHFECEDGKCGSCVVEVTVLGNKQPIGVNLTEKEKSALRLAGKITKEQIEAAETRDIPPPYRLACQFIVRDEDIVVRF
ncbi:MAG TPA: 2Fe-2S iron-sulfur cluster-binding protein, partial [Burkholderiaceae bacterium]|nr:2Fe-2S iron-sulfur cluster-binding protein [Burkholderiaceae bacterium]